MTLSPGSSLGVSPHPMPALRLRAGPGLGTCQRGRGRSCGVCRERVLVEADRSGTEGGWVWALPAALEQNLHPPGPPRFSGRHTCQHVMREHVSLTLRSWVSNSQVPRRARGSAWTLICTLSAPGLPHRGFLFLPAPGEGVQLRGRGGYLGSGARRQRSPPVAASREQATVLIPPYGTCALKLSGGGRGKDQLSHLRAGSTGWGWGGGRRAQELLVLALAQPLP